MNLRFTNWYTQALGATLGIIACTYSYLNGDMIIYSNIDTYFDTLEFTGVISSYLLLPLCIVTLLLAIIKSYNLNKSIFKISIENFNIGIIISTVIIGFMGAKIYFVVPAVFILFNLITYKKMGNYNENDKFDQEVEVELEQKKEIKIEINKDQNKNKEIDRSYGLSLQKEILVNNINNENIKDFENATIIFKKAKSLDLEDDNVKELNALETKLEMAQKLLEKKSDVEFILDVTGLTLEELENIKK
ncbi:MAG: hypothetical protein ACRC3Y_01040 [Romboutsia sp.]|uniref:hypothetical protein n=1 Tax=Romboutsia sp. TaxID=1965302 RepID=UPI003F2DC5F3